MEIVALMAYINPGTGSLFLQFLLVGVAGGWVAFKTSSGRIKALFTRKKSTRQSSEPDGR